MPASPPAPSRRRRALSCGRDVSPPGDWMSPEGIHWRKLHQTRPTGDKSPPEASFWRYLQQSKPSGDSALRPLVTVIGTAYVCSCRFLSRFLGQDLCICYYGKAMCDYAGVAELVDALDLGSSGGDPVKVRVLSPAPHEPHAQETTTGTRPPRTRHWRNVEDHRHR
jgi:hypothetical protein